ncbi:hypothetical protein HELRODRAFT_182857 [Helobdella robusta]|uniref:Fibrinogen C-terminal domain-containing protein n=1 Tax=Helobdella robusta TaxID=6412 RepID=T1FIV6_HELRO|nr:hypothetical protein HELRODRAFT_182857 [Helobdella robusta]ESN90065.1 hypothetical protein HELRODRAFT_182857 [Helobdella robusta]
MAECTGTIMWFVILTVLSVYWVEFVGAVLLAKYRATYSGPSPDTPTCCTDRPVYGSIKIISSKKIKSAFQCGLHCTQFNITDTDTVPNSDTVRSSCTFFNFKTNTTSGLNRCELYSSRYACFNTSVLDGCTLYQATPYLGFSIFDWLVILQRENRLYNFYLKWASYKEGFGIFPNNFWMGLEKDRHMNK